MELRRALLLFGIVLGIAAAVSFIARPADRPRDRTAESSAPPVSAPSTSTPTATARPEPASLDSPSLRIDPKHKTATVEPGRAATLAVTVDNPGQVELEGLGLVATAEPDTPARFDLLIERGGTHRVLLAPSAGGEPRAIGTLKVGK